MYMYQSLIENQSLRKLFGYYLTPFPVRVEYVLAY